MPRHFRIFVASPYDVRDERNLVFDLVSRLPYDPLLRGRVTLEVVAWDGPYGSVPLLAAVDPQSAVAAGLPLPSECDIVIVILHGRLGTPLPAKYALDGGNRPVTGTEWEYEEALKSNVILGTPEVLVYRRMSPVVRDLAATSAADLDEAKRQVKAVDDFFLRMEAANRGYNRYRTVDEFAGVLTDHLKAVLRKQIEEGTGRDRIVKWASGASSVPRVATKDIASFAMDPTEESQLRVLAIERIRNELEETANPDHSELAELAEQLMGASVPEVAKEGTRLAVKLIELGHMPLGVLRTAAANPKWEVQSHVVGLLRRFDSNDIVAVLDGIPSSLNYWRPVQTITEILTSRAALLSDSEREVATSVVQRLLSNQGQSDGQVRRLQETLELLTAARPQISPD